MRSTIERLRKAEAVFRSLSKKSSDIEIGRKNHNSPTDISSEPIAEESYSSSIYKKLDNRLRKIGLAAEQIEQKSLKELKTAHVQINACLRNPEVYLDFDIDQQTSKDSIEIQIRDTLIETKRILLERFSAMINQQKIRQINKIINTLEDKTIKNAIKKNLLQIAIKDQFLQKEYSSIKKCNNFPSRH